MTKGASADREASRKRVREGFRIIDLSAVGIAFPVAILLGYFGGRVIGGWLGSASTGAMIGTLLGIAGGFYNLLKMVARFAPRGRGAGAAGGDERPAAPTGGPAPASPVDGAEDRDDRSAADDWDGPDREEPDDPYAGRSRKP